MFARPLKLVLSKDAPVEKHLQQYETYLTQYFNGHDIKLIRENFEGLEHPYSVLLDPATFIREEFVNAFAYRHVGVDKYSFKSECDFFKKMQLSILRTKIAAINGDIESNRLISESFTRVADALNNEPWNENDYYRNLCITDYHIQFLNLHAVKPDFTVADVTKISKDFERKIYGAPPMNSMLKAAIFGVIGAMVGFAIGLVIGGASTLYAGGFGAAPAAFAGALKGGSLAVTIACSGIASQAGLVYGFFTSRADHRQHERDRINVNDQIPVAVKAAVVGRN